MPAWPACNYEDWAATCETLHAHSQVLGKLAAVLAPPEPQLQHAALRLTARGIETEPLPAPDGSGSFVALLDLHSHVARIEHSAGDVSGDAEVPLTPDRPVGEVTRALLERATAIAGPIELDLTPREVEWKQPLDEDTEHAAYDVEAAGSFFEAAMFAAQALAAFRAPYRGRSTPVNFWWGSFDLAVNLFSGETAKPPSDDFIIRNAMDVQEVAVGWWPGDGRYGKAAFYAYAHPAPEGFSEGELGPAPARWDDELGEFVLDWDDVRAADDPLGAATEFARSAFTHACLVCGWDSGLKDSALGDPPPVI